ncbi:hypothetical protein CIPAW_04G057800 [Carya illinoinensis]|uniref:Uncharacterized protein n=1 Tax=Carya illinoinensis TaxID=32201 RepID=A0A8T1QRA9_CARIL|nr:hypothetical protein CIPAW_04G057800 [Carya illinoinensis]
MNQSFSYQAYPLLACPIPIVTPSPPFPVAFVPLYLSPVDSFPSVCCQLISSQIVVRFPGEFAHPDVLKMTLVEADGASGGSPSSRVLAFRGGQYESVSEKGF